MLIMLLAGCEDDSIAEEYALNDLDSERTWGIQATSRLLAQPGLRGNVDAVENVVRAQKSYMLATLQKFKQEFGSVEAYLESVLKLDDSTVGVIKENLLRPW
jgi:protein tyrosine/serine phosphatase